MSKELGIWQLCEYGKWCFKAYMGTFKKQIYLYSVYVIVYLGPSTVMSCPKFIAPDRDASCFCLGRLCRTDISYPLPDHM
jgi:hypothetical protein